MFALSIGVAMLPLLMALASPHPPSSPDITAAISPRSPPPLIGGWPQDAGDSNEDMDHRQEDGLQLADPLKRTKRTPKIDLSRPYGVSRARGSTFSRYRYPVPSRRNSRLPTKRDYEPEDVDIPMMSLYEEYPEEDSSSTETFEPLRRPSLFRERGLPSSREMFLDEALPSSKLHASNPNMKRDRMYPENEYSYLRKTSESNRPSDRGISFVDPKLLSVYNDIIEELKEEEQQKEIRDKQLKAEETQLLRELVERAAGTLGGSGGDNLQHNSFVPVNMNFETDNPLVRRRRNTPTTHAPSVLTTPSTKMAAKNRTQLIHVPPKVSYAEYKATLAVDRKKRAYDIPQFDARNKRSFKTSMSAIHQNRNHENFLKRSSKEDLDDLLAREYFKSIARTVGDKKKRTNEHQFVLPESIKRSSNPIDNFLEDPQMLDYMMEKLKEAEVSVSDETQDDLEQARGQSDKEFLLQYGLVRMDALERMRSALEELRMLQQSQVDEKPMPVDVFDARKRRGGQATRAHPLLEVVPYQQPAGDCPALDRIISKCEEVSEEAEDLDRTFVPSCVRHQICYLCGSGLGVSAQECDSLLTSSLAAVCSDTLACISSAAHAVSLLATPQNYDSTGGYCAHLPCLRSLIESRR